MSSFKFAVNLNTEDIAVKLFCSFEIGNIYACFENAVDLRLHG